MPLLREELLARARNVLFGTGGAAACTPLEPIELADDDFADRDLRDILWCSFRFSLDSGKTPEASASPFVKNTPLG